MISKYFKYNCNKISIVGSFLFVILIYSSTLSTSVYLEDDGAFIYAAYSWGIAHPPGYPLYTNIAHFFSLIDISTIAARVHFVSTFFGSLTILLLVLICFEISGSLFSAIIAALTMAFTEIFWSQAIVAEVYTLNSAIFFLGYLVAIKWYRYSEILSEKQEKNYYFSLILILGLGLSNHWPLIVLSSPAILVLLWKKNQFICKNILLGFFALLIGLLPYLWMYLVADNQDLVITFGNIRNLKDFYCYLLRKGYSSVDHSSLADTSDKLRFIGFFFEQALENTGIAVASLIITGFFLFKDKLVMLSVILAILGSSIFLSLFLGFEYTGFNRLLFRVYPLIAYCVLAVPLSLTLAFIVNKLPVENSVNAKTYFRLIKLTFCFFPISLILTNYRFVDQSENNWGEVYAKKIINNLPQNSTLITSADTDSGVIGYQYFVEQDTGRDISVFQHNGLLYPNRLIHPYAAPDKREMKMKNFYQTRSNSVFFTNYVNVGTDLYNHGVLYGYANTEKYDDGFEELRHYFLDNIAFDFSTPLSWQNVHKQMLASQLLSYYLQRNQLENLSPAQRSNIFTHLNASNFYVYHLMGNMIKNKDMISAFFDHSQKLITYSFRNKDIADYYYLKAIFVEGLNGFSKKHHDDVIYLLEKSIDYYPTHDNKSVIKLLNYYQKNDQVNKIINLAKRLSIKLSWSP